LNNSWVKSIKKNWSAASLLVAVSVLFGILVLQQNDYFRRESTRVSSHIVDLTFQNYFDQVKLLTSEYEIDVAYVLSVIALESSGRKLVPHRFEPHVYEKLEKVSAGKLNNYEYVNYQRIKQYNVPALRDLASSWGPLQIMGYKCFEIDISIETLKGRDNLKHAIRWISKSYGLLLKEGRYKDAFHYHNTGRNYPKLGPPKTFHKEYVPKGLNYMEAFRKLIETEEKKL
jgi:hypothetical protein